MLKHQAKYEKIIETAFHEWGKTYFSKTSLSSIAAKMKMTKPAFYRYFKKKEDLELTLEKYFLQEFKKHIFSLTEYKNLAFTEFLRIYLKIFYTFFGQNPYYIYFFSSVVRKKSFLSRIEFIRILLREKRFFRYFTNKSSSELSEDDINSLLGYCYGTVFFFLFKEVTPGKSKNRIKPLSDEKIETLTDMSHKIIKYGFANKKCEVDFEKIERHSVLNEGEILKRDRIFDSITSVVANEGVWKASLKKIADNAGMSKSGFYFYYKNRDEMFGNMFFSEINRITELVNSRKQSCDGFFEKLYCNIAVEAGYLMNDIRILYFFDWIDFQKINMKYLNNNKKKIDGIIKNRYAFISDAVNSGLIKDHSLDLEFIAAFLNTQTVKELLIRIFNKKENRIQDVRRIYNLFLYGTDFYSI